MIETDDLTHLINQKDPEQLKKVIQVLIAKTRTLLGNLEETWDKFEQVQTEKDFWKESYFNLKTACEQYVDCGGLTPFNYIASLEQQLKKQKVYKSCLEEKFKVMKPISRSYNRKPVIHNQSIKNGSQNASINQHMGKSLSSTYAKETPERGKYQNKHKIGPKNIEFFKFGEQKHSQVQTKRL